MSRRDATPDSGRLITSAAPAWFSWIFFLIGVCFVVGVYYGGFRPEATDDGVKLFDEPDDIDLWGGMAVVVMAFSGAGAAMLAHRTTWTISRSFRQGLRNLRPAEPWTWRADWQERRIRPEQMHGRRYYLAWAILCLLAAVPGCERLFNSGGWPNDPVDWTALGSLAVGVLALLVTGIAAIRQLLAPTSRLHLAGETGVLGGPLEGAVEYPSLHEREYLVRLVCERHWIQKSVNSKGQTSSSMEVSTEYEDTYRAFSDHNFIPVRFAVPMTEPPTSTDRTTPVYLWYVELEDAVGKRLARFWTPVFKTEESRPGFTLGKAKADRSIAEETDASLLSRYGISVDDQGSQMLIQVPAGLAAGMGWMLLLFAIPFSAVSFFMLPKLWNWEFKFTAIFDILTGMIFGGVFGLFGLMFTVMAVQLIFERRRIEIDRSAISVRKSYLFLGRTSRLAWEDIKKINLTHSGSMSGSRRQLKNVIALTHGMTRKDGSRMSRRWSIINSVPDEAAKAAQSIIQSLAPSNAGRNVESAIVADDRNWEDANMEGPGPVDHHVDDESIDEL